MTIMERAGLAKSQIETRNNSLAFAMWAAALVQARREKRPVAEVFAQKYPRSIHVPSVQAHQKAVVSVGTTLNDSAALALPNGFGAGFVEYLRGLSVFELLAPRFRAAPLNVQIPRQTSGSSVSWTGQGAPVQANPLSFDLISLPVTKVSGIIGLSNELVRLSDPSATVLIRNELGSAVSEFLDDAFLNPEYAAVTDVSPASITNAAGTQVASTGTTATQIETDVGNLFDAIQTNRTGLVLIISRTAALTLCKLRTTNGARVFPDLTLNGGTVLGVETIVTANAPEQEASPQQHYVVALDTDEILLGDLGVEVDSSENAIVQFDSAPDDPADANTVMTSLWQHNLVGVKINRLVNWQPRRARVAAYISDASWA